MTHDYYVDRQFSLSHGTLLADASDLGLRPGETPLTEVHVLFADEHLERFAFEYADWARGDLTAWHFANLNPFSHRRELVIVND